MIYGCVKTAIGTVCAAVSDRGRVCAVEMRTSPDEFERSHPGCVRNDDAVREVLDRLRRYLDGDDADLDDIPVDLSAATDFGRSVLLALRRVPKGRTVSYGELAALAGKPGAARAVGNIMASNPVPLIIPCHRVVRSDGSLGGFGSGTDLKEFLLREIEHADRNELTHHQE